MQDYFYYKATSGFIIIIQNIFRSFNRFKCKIRRVFEDINKIKTAETLLYNLKQIGLVILYATEFQKYATKTGWDSNALVSMYYKGLKNHVKLELV